MKQQLTVKKIKILLIGTYGVLFCIAYFPVMQRLINSWAMSEEYSHGFLIVPISLYLVWNKRETLLKVESYYSTVGQVIFFLSLVLYLFSTVAEISTLASISMVLTLSGSIIALYGFKMFRVIAFPVFFLFFMIPVPAQIIASMTIPLQLFVSKISVISASLLGIPIFREGNIIYLPEKTLQVVQACSGLRSLVSLLTLSLIFGYFSFKSNIMRTVLFIAGVPVAIFVNIIRVFLIISAFYYIELDLTKGSIHTIMGILIFALALGCILVLGRILSRWDDSIM